MLLLMFHWLNHGDLVSFTLDNLRLNATASLTSNLTECLHFNPMSFDMIALDGLKLSLVV